MPQLELVLVHVPKTGGSTLKKVLKHRFGEGLFKDYQDSCLTQSELELAWQGGFPDLAGKRAVIGHFAARKYEPVGAAVWLTVLRHPLDRAISHFFHYRSMPPRTADWRKVHAGEMDFAAFTALPAIRLMYSGRYFRDTDMALFDVVDHDALFSDWDAMASRLGFGALRAHGQNRAAKLPGYAEMRQALRDDAAVMRQANANLAEDIAFYEAWVGRRPA